MAGIGQMWQLNLWRVGVKKGVMYVQVRTSTRVSVLVGEMCAPTRVCVFILYVLCKRGI